MTSLTLCVRYQVLLDQPNKEYETRGICGMNGGTQKCMQGSCYLRTLSTATIIQRRYVLEGDWEI
jgi:hypothetical protein